MSDSDWWADLTTIIKRGASPNSSFPFGVYSEMSESPDTRSLVSASSQLNLMEVGTVRN